MARNRQSEPEVIPPGMADDGEGSEAAVNTSALGVLEVSALNTLIEAAGKRPRTLKAFIEEMDALVTTSKEVAASMTYSLPRSDKQIIGPSIRFAECVMYCWRNMAIDVRPLEVGDTTLTAQAQIFDLERLSRFGWNVSRNITGKYGRYNADMIGTTMAAASSIAYRNAILKYVPKAAWFPLWEKSKMAAIGKVEAIGQQRIDALQYLNKMGITNVQIFNALRVPGIDDIDVDKLTALRTWSRELKAGERTIEDIFGSQFDAEIEKLMKLMGWPETKKRMSRENFAGNPEAHLDYLHGEAKKMGVEIPAEKEEDTANRPATHTNANAEASSTAQASSQGEPSKAQSAAPPVGATNGNHGTTAAASTSQASKKAIPEDW